MVYVILDLEWNNTYGRKTKSFINEIIEIGAVMLDDELREVSRFSRLIRAQIGKYAWMNGKQDRLLAFFRAFDKYRAEA